MFVCLFTRLWVPLKIVDSQRNDFEYGAYHCMLGMNEKGLPTQLLVSEEIQMDETEKNTFITRMKIDSHSQKNYET